MQIRHRWALVALVGPISAAAACSSSDEEDDDASGGAAVHTGGATGTGAGGSPASGGSSGPAGGSPASGGAAAGGSPAASGGTTASGGTATATGGGPSTGGSAGTDLSTRIATYCSNKQANGMVLGCTAVFPSTYVSSCVAELTAAAQSCPSEVEALLDCSRMLPALDYACDANDDVGFASGVCSSETAALDQCLS